MTESPAFLALRKAVAQFHSHHDLPLPENADCASFQYDGVAFTVLLLQEPQPALWIACDLGPIDFRDPVALRWLLQESFEPWAHARVHVGCDAAQERAIASCRLDADHGTELDPVIGMLATATRNLREILSGGKFPDILHDPLATAAMRI